MEPLIFHVDVNSAYLSWGAARRVANGEAGRAQPAVEILLVERVEPVAKPKNVDLHTEEDG